MRQGEVGTLCQTLLRWRWGFKLYFLLCNRETTERKPSAARSTTLSSCLAPNFYVCPEHERVNLGSFGGVERNQKSKGKNLTCRK